MKGSTVKTICISALVVLFALVSMGQSGCFDILTPKPAPSLPEATPEGIWKYITEDNPYTTWSTFPSERIPSYEVWKDDYVYSFIEGLVIKIYINDIGLAALDKKPRNMPNGSIIIADVYPIEGEGVGEHLLIAGFYKVEGSTARDNDWVSFAYAPDGSVAQADYGPCFGTKTHCYSCHETAENDHIWVDSPKMDPHTHQLKIIFTASYLRNRS